MPIATSLRDLQADLPGCPTTLVKMAEVMADEHCDLAELSALIESDMALAAAMVRTLNSALFGLVRRVSSVQEACQYLGMAQVAALTYEISLRGVFPPTPPLQALWDRACLRGMAMGKMANQWGVSAWNAHTLGLFAEAGRAVLMAKRPELYHGLRAVSAPDWASMEEAEFGVHQGALGSALCRTWLLSHDVADAVRAWAREAPPWPGERPEVQSLLGLSQDCEQRISGLTA